MPSLTGRQPPSGGLGAPRGGFPPLRPGGWVAGRGHPLQRERSCGRRQPSAPAGRHLVFGRHGSLPPDALCKWACRQSRGHAWTETLWARVNGDLTSSSTRPRPDSDLSARPSPTCIAAKSDLGRGPSPTWSAAKSDLGGSPSRTWEGRKSDLGAAKSELGGKSRNGRWD